MNKDKRNNIQLLGTLNNADESGIIANANQVYDANEDKSTQDVSKEHKERIETLETKENSMQTTLENITKTGEASAASNVTYNHSDSKLDATNVQQAVDEMRELINTHEGNIEELQDSVNEINQQVTNGPDDFSLQDEASNILCLWKDGHIRTKNFDSQNVGGKVESDSGHIKFKAVDGKGYEQHEYVEKPIPTISFVTPSRYCNASDAAASYIPTTNKFAAAMIAVTSQDVVTIPYLMGIALDTTDSAYATQGTGDYPITLGLYDSAKKLIGVLDKTTTAQTNKVIDFRKELTLVKSSTTSTYTLTAGSTYYLYIQTQANSSSVTDSSTTDDYVNACKNQINAITIESHVLKDIEAIDANGVGVDIVDNNNIFDFDIEDENQNILVGLRDGHIKTKNFDSKETLQVIDGLKNNPGSLNGVYLQEDTSNDFSVKDENGNAIVVFNKGHIKTKNFDSGKIDNSSPSVTVEKELPTPVIFDTDWMDDVDDAVALRVLLWAERQGMIDIVGINIDSVISTSAKSLSCFLNYEGRQGLCIGLEKEITGISSSNKYHSVCINNFPYYDYGSNDSCEDSVTFYRRALSKIEQKVNIILVGFPTSLYRLLQSSSDSYSSLNGVDLVKEKVNKIYFMGGGYPTHTNENNLARNTTIANCSDYILKNCPVPIVFLGFEVGNSVITGNTLSNSIGKDDLLYKCLDSYGASTGRSSWDPMLTLLACIDNPEAAGYSVIVGTNSVDTSTLVNTFTTDPNGTHSYVTKRHPDSYYAYMINNIIEKRAWKYRKLGEQSLNIL